MEVRPGYKLTEVGVIPEDWAVASLQDVVDFVNGKPHEGNVRHNGRYCLITLDSIGIDGGLKREHKRTDTWDGSLKKQDIVAVLSDLAHGNLLGLCDLIPEDNTYVLNQRMGRLRLKVEGDPLFVRFQINRRQNHFRRRGQGTSQRHIYKRDFYSLDIPFASEPEQRAIAAALSDVDALLGGLDRLIAKKRDLKQAAMQKLLTGQIRLPGFHGEWNVKRLGELLSYEQPTKYLVKNSDYSDANDIPVLTAGKTFILGYTDEGDGVFSNLPVIIFDDFTTATKYVTFPFKAKSSAMKLLKPRSPSVNLRLVYEMMQLIQFKLSEHKRYWISEFQKLEVKMPGGEEQTAIAAVLSDMDTELSALEAWRDKTRALTQGMMQELLTGRTRLV
jgi:type I restriction enzyme, S subunit